MKGSTRSTRLLVFALGCLVVTVLILGCDTQIKREKQVEGEEDMFSSISGLFTDSGAFEQTFSESIPARTETDMIISHSHGNITVKGWDKDEVELEGKKIVKARDEETARMYAQQMKVEVRSEDSKIIVETIRPERDRSWEIRQITINYDLYAPERLNVALKSEHGNVLVENFEGKLDVNSSHGDFQVAQIGKDASIRHEHGDIEVSEVGGDASVKKEHGKLRIESVSGTLKLDQEHGEANLNMIGKTAELDIQHTDLIAVDVGGTLKLDHEHGEVQLKQIAGNVEISKEHGTIDIETVNGSVSIQSDHGSLRIIDIEGDVYVRGAHGDAHVENVSGSADVSRAHGKVRLHNVERTVSH